MPIIVPLSAVQVGAQIPSQLAPYINAHQWADITNTCSVADNNATGIACGVEWLTCILCCVPLCLCHVCIQPQIAVAQLRDNLLRVNAVSFGGRQVCQASDQCLIFNVELLTSPANISTPAFAVPVNPVPLASATPVPLDSMGKYAPVPVQGPGSQPQRCFTVVIPQDAGPGSIINSIAPDGTTVQVQVPQGVQPGQQITVTY